jgi:hypothetical protein
MIARCIAFVLFVALVGAASPPPTSPTSAITQPAGVATFMPVPPPPSTVPSMAPTSGPSPSQPIGSTPTPNAGASTPQPKPPSNLLTYTGQLLDVRNNYVYFTTGDAFAAVNPLRVVSYDTGLVTSVQPTTKMYAKATFDTTTHKIIELAITTHHVPVTQSTDALIGYAIEKSQKTAAEELSGGQRLTGRPVTVVFEVTAPPTTNITDTLYISTDAGGWNPMEIKLDRVDAYRYRAERTYASGTKFSYRVTRGSWNSVERGEDGLDSAPHQFFVREVDSLAARVTVYHWSDENPAHPEAGPESIPTPYNSNPFGGGPGGISVPQMPTAQPTRFR